MRTEIELSDMTAIKTVKSYIKVVDPINDGRWDEFVIKNPAGSIYHHSLWGKILQKTYGFSFFYVALENKETGSISGGVPFMYIQSKITGKRLVSLPYTTYCGRLATKNELESIIRFAWKKHPGIKYLEMRFLCSDGQALHSHENRSDYVNHILELDRDPSQLLLSFHGTSVRQRIKRAERNGLELDFAEKEGDLKEFYRLYVKVRKRLGLPPHPFEFFLNVWRELKPCNFVTVPFIKFEGKVVAAALVLKFKDTFHFEYSASDSEYLKLCPNQKLIWETIKLAHQEGAKYFDFGRSSLSNSSLIEFKERWATKKQDLVYYFYPKSKKLNTETSTSRRMLGIANRHLPESLLRLEGKLMFRHLG